MPRSDRLFEVIQVLRAAKAPMTADDLARRLEVSVRTIYRDIATLQARQTPIEGAPGIGYVMRSGYDLPPLNFDADERDALRVGLAMLARTGDGGLQSAALRIHRKIDALHGSADWMQVAPWGAPPDDTGAVCGAGVRDAIRSAAKLELTYRDESGAQTQRVVRPLALVYHLDCVMLAGFCELRGDFRHFRTDRIEQSTPLEARFTSQVETLRALWWDKNKWDGPTLSGAAP
ncbi:YafY family protein [Roseobacter sp.]|uniref:helix-turn-helix transcriptional regulator n=1 Tax=Roseobacter sp. TaxID=1907202 RepID=UPI00329976F1